MDSADDQITPTGTASAPDESAPATTRPGGADSGIKTETASETAQVHLPVLDQTIPRRPITTGHEPHHDLVRRRRLLPCPAGIAPNRPCPFPVFSPDRK